MNSASVRIVYIFSRRNYGLPVTTTWLVTCQLPVVASSFSQNPSVSSQKEFATDRIFCMRYIWVILRRSVICRYSKNPHLHHFSLHECQVSCTMSLDEFLEQTGREIPT